MPRGVPNPKDRSHYERLAQEMLDYIGSIDPMWKERIDITRTEFSLDALQCLGSYVGQVLEAGHHTIVPRHPFFEPGFVANLVDYEAPCPQCGKTFKAAYAGQPLCSNECAIPYYKEHPISG